MSLFCALLPALVPALSPAPAAEGRLTGPEAIYAAVSPAVVGIESWSRPEDPQAYGTGVIVHPQGLILTSITVAPPEATRFRVYLRGGRTADADRLRSVPAMELVLLRLLLPAGAPGRPFPFLPLGDSSGLQVGQAAYALGNAFHSISEDDQVSFFAGAISGGYVLTEARSESRYLGPAIETTAAVNDGMDGGPLVNSRGEVVGLLSLNFSRSRWLGVAIPVNVLKPFMLADVGCFSDRLERFPAYVGLELEQAALFAPSVGLEGAEEGRRAVIARVDPGGPADRAGLEKGDRLSLLNGVPLQDVMEFRLRFMRMRPGERFKLGIERGGERREVDVTLWGNY